MEHKKYPERRIRHWISFPFMWIMIIPLLIMHVFIMLYQFICFPLWKIQKFKLRNYIKFDRIKLNYLSISDKLGCTYCSYANGLVNYSAAIAGTTEKYWCGIKHDKYNEFVPSPHQIEKDFIDYGDEKTLLKELKENRKKYCYKDE